jgi:hypothetical protein
MFLKNPNSPNNHTIDKPIIFLFNFMFFLKFLNTGSNISLKLKMAQIQKSTLSLFFFKFLVLPIFPFYTLGRFSNDVCTGTNQLTGTCVISGSCTDLGGVGSGSCASANTRQATCCVSK